MLKDANYKNGQKIFKQKGDILTYFFKTGIIKAKGKHVNGLMEGKWIFNRESGQLWQVGSFKKGIKHGKWIRYNKICDLEHEAEYQNGKIVKPDSKSGFPKIGAPAERALKNAGCKNLKQLTKFTEVDLLNLHGMGPKAVGILKKEMKLKNLSFKK
jgi:hypothetical protein